MRKSTAANRLNNLNRLLDEFMRQNQEENGLKDRIKLHISRQWLTCPFCEKNSVKVIIMSATLQLDVFGRYFTPPGEVVQDAIFVGVRRFPVQQIFLDTLAEDIPGVADGLVSKVVAGFLEANVAPKFSNDANLG